MNKIINIFTDGGARGNPGPAAIGVYIEDENKKEISSFGKTIGSATNNVAEYRAVVEALLWISNNKDLVLGTASLNFYMDSKLVCSQINRIFKIKNDILKNYLFQIRELENKIKMPIHYNHIPREKNVNADRLVNMALDSEFYLP